MSCPLPVVACPREVNSPASQVRVSVSSEASSSSELIGVSDCPTGMVAPRGSGPAEVLPGNTSICMSFSGVFGTNAACASRNIRGSFEGSIDMWTIAWPSFSSVPVIWPTRTPATFTGSPRPATTAVALGSAALTE